VASAGFPGTFESSGLIEFGDFALIAQGPGGTNPVGTLVGGIFGILMVAVLVVLLLWSLVRWGVSRARLR